MSNHAKSNPAKSNGMIQVRKGSGSNYYINLDHFTVSCLKDCREKLQCGDKRLSNNVLIRTAIRHYYEHINRLGSQELALETKIATDASS